MSKKYLLLAPLLVLAGYFIPQAPKLITEIQTQTNIVQVTPPLTIEGLWTGSNLERTKLGLDTLDLDQDLNLSANDKCLDMQAKDYWAHNAPDGTEPWAFIQKYVSLYYKAGENLAYGQPTNEIVTQNWMSSQLHKENIVDTAFNKVGYAICDFRGTKLIVQHFTN
jgi:uncharacterized protein YkwD